jgi:hypothetical protein
MESSDFRSVAKHSTAAVVVEREVYFAFERIRCFSLGFVFACILICPRGSFGVKQIKPRHDPSMPGAFVLPRPPPSVEVGSNECVVFSSEIDTRADVCL